MITNSMINNSNDFEKHKNKLNKNKSKKLNSNNILLYSFEIINNLNIYEPKDISYNFINPILNPLMFDLKNNLFSNDQLVNYNYYISEYYNLKNNNLNISLNKKENDFFEMFPNIKDYFNPEKKKVKLIQINNKKKTLELRNRTPPSNSNIKNKELYSLNQQNHLKNENKIFTTKNTHQIISSRKCISPNPTINLKHNPKLNNKNKNDDNIFKYKQHNSFTNDSNNSRNHYNIDNANNNIKKNNHQKLNTNRPQKNNKKIILLNSLIKQYKRIQNNSPLKSPNINTKKTEHKKLENSITKKENLPFTKEIKNNKTKSILNKRNNTNEKITNYSKEKTKLNKSFDIPKKNDIFETLHNTQIIDSSCLKDYKYDNKFITPNTFTYEDEKKENERNTGYLGQEDFFDRFSFK